MKKRFLSVLMVLCMTMCIMPATALAEGTASALPDAVNGVITLNSDVALDAAYVVSEGESILLDLNGYSITRGTYTKSALIQVNTGGNLVVRDNSAAKAGRIYSTNALDTPGKTSIGLGIWAVGGTVTIESGTVEGTYALYATQSGTINVAGGTVSGTTLGVYANNSTVNISGGEVKATGENSAAAEINGSGLNISGGTLSGVFGINLFNTPYGGNESPWGNSNEAVSSSVNMTAGAVTATYYALSGNNQRSAKTSVTISGGSLRSAEDVAIYWPMEGDLTISGGTITGYNGIEAKMGTINISGGTITGNGDYVELTEISGNGSSPDGSALLLPSEKYGATAGQYINSPDLTVNITGGTFVSSNGNAITTYNSEISGTQTASVTISDANLNAAQAAVKVITTGGNTSDLDDGNGSFTTSKSSTTVTVSGDAANVAVDAGGKTSYYTSVNEALQNVPADTTEATVTVYGDDTLTENADVPEGITLTVAGNATLTVSEGVTLSGSVATDDNGSIVVQAGATAPEMGDGYITVTLSNSEETQIIAKVGGTITLPAYANTAYSAFVGWLNTTTNQIVPGGTPVEVTTDVIYVAQWQAIYYPPIGPTNPSKPTTPDKPDEPDTWVNPYTDVSVLDWFYDEVAYVSAKGLMTGTTATTFLPNADTSRAMIWTVLGRMAGENVEGGSPWYAAAQSWAVSAGVSDGTEPNSAITREQLVTMLYRQAGSPEVGVSELARLGQFTDGESVSDWAEEAMAWAVSNGILTGDGDMLKPQGSATRAQVAAILARFCQNNEK